MTLTRGGGGLPAGLALTKLVLCSLSRLPLLYAAPLTSSAVEKLAHVPKPPDEFSLWLYLSIAAALVLSGGAFAGLTIALMGQVSIYTIDSLREKAYIPSWLTLDANCRTYSRMKSTSKLSRRPAKEKRENKPQRSLTC